MDFYGLPDFSGDTMTDALLSLEGGINYYGFTGDVKDTFLAMVGELTNQQGDNNPFADVHDKTRRDLQQFLIQVKSNRHAAAAWVEMTDTDEKRMWKPWFAATILNIADLPRKHFEVPVAVTGVTSTSRPTATSVDSRLLEKDQSLLLLETTLVASNVLNGKATSAIRLHRGTRGSAMPRNMNEFQAMVNGVTTHLLSNVIVGVISRSSQVMTHVFVFVNSNLLKFQVALQQVANKKILGGDSKNPSVLIDGRYADIMSAIAAWAAARPHLGSVKLSNEQLHGVEGPLNLMHELYCFFFVHMRETIVNFTLCAKTLVNVYGRTKTKRPSPSTGGNPIIKRRKETALEFTKRHETMNARNCYNCGKTGHIARDCKAKKATAPGGKKD